MLTSIDKSIVRDTLTFTMGLLDSLNGETGEYLEYPSAIGSLYPENRSENILENHGGEMTTILPVILTVLAFVAVFVVSVIVLTVNNARKAAKLARLEKQKEGLTLLAHAMEYLTKEGIGYNLEWTSARVILETAMYNVLYSGE